MSHVSICWLLATLSLFAQLQPLQQVPMTGGTRQATQLSSLLVPSFDDRSEANRPKLVSRRGAVRFLGSLLFESRIKTNYPEVGFALLTFSLTTPNDSLLEHGEDSQAALYKLSYQKKSQYIYNCTA